MLELSPLKGEPFDAIIKAVRESGYTPLTIREDDFIFNITPQNSHYVLVPLSRQVSERTIAVLRHYVSSGGKVILIPPSSSTPDSSVQRLFQIIGLTVTGSPAASLLSQPLDLQWESNAANPLLTGFPLSEGIISVVPDTDQHVLATWKVAGAGETALPAVVATSKGALLNWLWGRKLPMNDDAFVLSKVIPLLGGELPAREPQIVLGKAAPEPPHPNANGPIALTDAHTTGGPVPAANASEETPKPAGQTAVPTPQPEVSTDMARKEGEPKAEEKLQAVVSEAVASIQAAGAVEVIKTPEPGTPKETAHTDSSAPSPEAVIDTPPVATAIHGATPPVTPAPDNSKLTESVEPTASLSESKKPEQPPVASNANNPVLSAQPATAAVPNTLPSKSDDKAIVATVPNQPAAKSGDTKSNEDAEVINNILGGEVVKPTQPANTGSQPSGETGQKHFSFLDPEAREMLAPEFDYGLYSMYMRFLDNYKKRISDALETSKQLSLNLPKDRVMSLVKESDLHKRQFESLYLNNQTQAGLDEFALARKNILSALALTTQSAKVEGRAIWLDRATVIDSGSPAGLKKVFQRMHQAGINIVYFETLNAGFPAYPSKIIKNNPMINGWDPLKTAVEEGHRLGMEVHAWVWAFAVGNRRHNPLIGMPAEYPGPVLVEDGMMSEALRNRDGGLSVDSHQNEFWLSPASPKARDFLLNVYKEIVSNYDVDGLQLDYIRYPFQAGSTKMGFESVGRERFNKSTGMSLDNLDDYTAKLWIAWKTYQVSSFVQQVSETLRKIKPDIKLSAAVFPLKRDARIVAIQQDWETWIDNGWIDTLSPMSYTTDPERLQELFTYVNNSPHKHTLVYPGIAINRLDGGQLVLHLQALKEKGSLGETLFAGAYLDNEKLDTLSNGPFKEQNSLPPHRDVVRSLQTVLADYQEKFEKLRTENNLPNLTADGINAIQGAMSQFGAALNSISGKPPSQIPPAALQVAVQQFRGLQAVTGNWTSADKAMHPYRAQYFSQISTILDELLGYLSDKVSQFSGTGVATKFAPPGAIKSVVAESTNPNPSPAPNPSTAVPAAQPAASNTTTDENAN